MHRNIYDLQVTDLKEFGQKHFLWWFGFPCSQELLERLKYPSNAVTLEGEEDCLFIVVVRDPYDWLRSFYKAPWCVALHLREGTFSDFVSLQWEGHPKYIEPDGQYDLIDNYNPWTGMPFRNILELRRYKTLNYLKLGELSSNFMIVRYEDVRDDPQGFITFVSQFFGLRKTDELVPVDTYKGSHVRYVPSKYLPIDEDTLNLINSEIDWEVEAFVGFSLKEKVE